jgi:hypothetical protein
MPSGLAIRNLFKFSFVGQSLKDNKPIGKKSLTSTDEKTSNCQITLFVTAGFIQTAK